MAQRQAGGTGTRAAIPCACPGRERGRLVLEGLGNGLVRVSHRCSGTVATFSWHGEHNGGDGMPLQVDRIRRWLAGVWLGVAGTVPVPLKPYAPDPELAPDPA